MRITIGQLRRIIKEEVSRSISEAPLADDGILPMIDIRKDTTERPHWMGKPATPRSVDRFHRSPEFKAKAERTFGNFPMPVYVIPAVVESRNSVLGMDRTVVMDPERGLDFLQKSGSTADLEHLRGELGKGAVVFLNMSSHLAKGFLPTPWMMVHAIFDDDYAGVLDQEKNDIFDLISELKITEGQLMGRMTMKSARDGTITRGAPDDMISELMTQAIVSKDGVRFIMSDDDPLWKGKNPLNPETTEKMMKLKSAIDAMDLKGKFFKAISGKVVSVSVGTSN